MPLLTDKELVALDRVGQILHRQAGHTFFREGEETDFALLIKKGHVRVLAGRPARIVAFRKRDEIVGEMAAIRGKPRSATVIAHDEVEVLHLPAPDFLEFLYEHPRALHALLVDSDERLDQATRKIVGSDLAVERRLAGALVELVDEGVAEHLDGVLVARFPQADLASLTGTSLESVKKIVRLLKESKIIDTGRGSISIHDVDLLKEIAMGNRTASR
jgi:CRP/FNR family cyclic AMP-dependent transcriptional regulator